MMPTMLNVPGTSSALHARDVVDGADVGATGVFLAAVDGQVLSFERQATGSWTRPPREHGSSSRKSRPGKPNVVSPTIQGGEEVLALARDGSLVDDFRISRLGAVVAIRNAPSPGATSSLAIAEHIVYELAQAPDDA